MPHAGGTEPGTERRLPDLVAWGVLTRAFPPGLVDDVIARTGRTEQRHRSLPARVMAYFSIGMALHPEGSYDDVLAHVTDGLSWASGRTETYRPPSRSAIVQARARLGAEPVRALFERVAGPVGTGGTPDAWLAGRRLVAMDGTCLDVADTAANAQRFGRPGTTEGRPGTFPQARVVALAEGGTRAVLAAEVGACTEPEPVLAGRLVDRLVPGMLMTADRRSFSRALWCRAAATGADLLWRTRTAPSCHEPDHVEDLPDGSWLADLRPTDLSATTPAEPVRVRVVDHALDDRPPGATVHRLLTTVLDPAEASATDLATAHARRWSVEPVVDELGTALHGPRAVLRSRSPDLVLQEIWGRLCCHHAIRSLLAETTSRAGHERGRPGRPATVRIVPRTSAGPGGSAPERAGTGPIDATRR